MKFVISGKWPLSDILPESKETTSAREALRHYRDFVRRGMVKLTVLTFNDDTNGVAISQWKLGQLAAKEAEKPSHRPVARILLAVIASMLADGFGDLGAVSRPGTLGAAPAFSSSSLILGHR
ncbi:MAG: hypothetical protein U1E60_26990 [Reyranellaceae bacterium]